MSQNVQPLLLLFLLWSDYFHDIILYSKTSKTLFFINNEIPCWLPTALNGGEYVIEKPTEERAGKFLYIAPVLMIKVKLYNDKQNTEKQPKNTVGTWLHRWLCQIEVLKSETIAYSLMGTKEKAHFNNPSTFRSRLV